MKALSTLALTGLTAAVLSVFAAPASAQEQDYDHFTLRLGAMNADGNGTLKGSGDLLGNPVDFNEDFDFGSNEISPRIDGVWRITQRNRVIFDYFRYDKNNTQTLGQDISFEDTTVPAGSFAKLDTRFQLASLIYDFSVVDTDTFSAGLQLGAEWAKLDGKFKADAGPDVGTFTGSAKEDGVAPVVGVRFTATPSDRWLINVQGQYLDATWGSFDYDGKIKRANAIVEYRVTQNFGVFAGYDWFKINYNESGRDASGGIDLEFKGPMAGVTFAF
jgi:hypothetical protein